MVIAVSAYPQLSITWDQLKDVKFTDKYNEELGAYVQVPAFGKNVQALAGREVQITGYVIPLDIPGGIYVLSANPYATCFFCGGGGPESVMDIRFPKVPRRFRTDERITLRGKLRLNATDIYALNYVLENATLVK